MLDKSFRSSCGSDCETLIILGTGPAGLTAAIYAARANLNPLVIEGMQPGGQLTITSDIENFPGFSEGISGSELMDKMRQQAERFGARFIGGDVVSAELSQQPFVVRLQDGTQLKSQLVIIAVGAAAKWLGLSSEKRLRSKGVSACATCDGFFFRNQDVAVVGGGDTALEEATFLTRFAKSVTVIHRRDSLRASKIMQDKSFSNPKIKFVWNSTVDEILGEKEVTGIRIRSVLDNSSRDIPVTGVFVAIGHEPNTKAFRSELACSEAGYILVEPGSTRTNIPGVYAAGDVADHIYRQAITAAGTGCMAAIEAERFLELGIK